MKINILNLKDKKYFSKFFLLLGVGLFLPTFVDAGTTNITTCQSLNVAGETYVLQNDVSSDGTCFVVGANDIELDLGGHTVTYGNEAPINIPNGSFEDLDMSAWDLSLAGNSQRMAGTYINPVSVFDGQYALKAFVPTTDQFVQSVNEINLKANTKYHISAMVFNRVSDAIDLSIELDGTSALKTHSGQTWRGFQYIFATYTTGAVDENHKINLRISGADSVPSGAVYIDDVRIQRTMDFGVQVGASLPTFENMIWAKRSTIKNGSVIQGQAHSDFSHAIGVYGTVPDDANPPTSYNIEVANLNIEVSGNSSKAIFSPGSISNSTIHDLHITGNTEVIEYRDHYDGALINFSQGQNASIYNVTIDKGIQTGIYIGGSAGIPPEIYNNNITLQSKYTNDFAIVASSSNVHDNIINCGSDNNSCRGIYLGPYASVGGGSVYNNNISVQQLLRNQEYGGCEAGGAYGIQLENYHDANVYDNIVNANAGVCEAHALRLNLDGATFVPANNIFHGNVFSAIASGAARASSIKTSKIDADEVNFSDNTFRTNRRWIYKDSDRDVVLNFSCNKWETVGTIDDPFYPFEAYPYLDSHAMVTFHNNSYGEGDQARLEGAVFRNQLSWPNPDIGSSVIFTTGDPQCQTDIIAPSAPSGLSVI